MGKLILITLIVGLSALASEAAVVKGNDIDTQELAISDLVQVRDNIKYTLGNQTQVTWFEAQVICNAAGKKLASVDNNVDFSNLVTTLAETEYLPSGDFWLSGNNFFGALQWAGKSGDLTYKKWDRNEPSKQTGKTHGLCIAVKPNYKWAAVDCNKQNYFICEETSTGTNNNNGQTGDNNNGHTGDNNNGQAGDSHNGAHHNEFE